MRISEILRRAGQLLYGEVRPTQELAMNLQVDPRKIRRWLSETEELPADHGVVRDLEFILRTRAAKLIDLADAIEAARNPHAKPNAPQNSRAVWDI